MDNKTITRFFACLVFIFGSTQVLAEPQLNGLAVSVELNKERFIAALYSSNLSSNADDLLVNSGERRMELKVTARRFSARSLNNMWIEGMAINNSSSVLRAESENLSKMVNMIRKSLTTGDTLTFDTSPGAGTTITLNGVQLGVIESEDFFSLLLRTWIGNVPLSSEFKTDLLAGGKFNQGLRDRYAVIQPTDARIAAVEGWGTPEPAAAPQVAAAPAITPPRPQVQISAPTTRIQPPASETIEAIRRQDPAQVAESLPATRPTAEAPANNEPAEPEVEVSEPVQVARVTTPTPTPPANNRPQERPATPPAEDDEEEFDEDEEEEVVFTAESLLERQLYISDVLRQAQRLVKYPDRALRREQEGTVIVSATLDRTGQLLGTLTVEESRYNILNKEAEESIERAAPYKPFPDSMTDQTYSFTIPVTFKISR